jgi:CarD family transcriptional regulator
VTKKPAAKIVKKTAVKKPAAKIVKKTTLAKTPKKNKPVEKAVKKPISKLVKKEKTVQSKSKTKPTKKVEVKKTKTAATKKAAKPLSKKELAMQDNVKHRKALAKSILATTNKKSVEEELINENQIEAFPKIILTKKYEVKNKVSFKVGDYAVYPSHGIGKISGIEKATILGQDFSCYLMYFEREKLMIKIPISSADKIGLRHLISKPEMDEVFVILRSGVKKLKGMWSRRAQEYETKINSGDIILLAEVLRDLTRDIEDGERSYSERIIYETAIYRLASEYSVIYGIDLEEAKEKVTLTAKDKLNSEGKIIQKDDFDDFDSEIKKSNLDDEDEEDEEEEDEEEEDEEDDYDDYDDDDDDAPKKGRRR